MKSGNLNFLETSGTLQACNGTSLPSKFKPMQNGRLIRATFSVAPVAFAEQNSLNWNSICPRTLLFLAVTSVYTKLHLTSLQAFLTPQFTGQVGGQLISLIMCRTALCYGGGGGFSELPQLPPRDVNYFRWAPTSHGMRIHTTSLMKQLTRDVLSHTGSWKSLIDSKHFT